MTTKYAAKLEVTARHLNGDDDNSTYTFVAYEFNQGKGIIVLDDMGDDYFFESRNAIESHGCTEVISVEDTDEAKHSTCPLYAKQWAQTSGMDGTFPIVFLP